MVKKERRPDEILAEVLQDDLGEMIRAISPTKPLQRAKRFSHNFPALRLPTSLFIVALLAATTAFGANSVTRNDVTWTFDKEYETGVFANGDPYVVAPNGVTIKSISPKWDGTKNGTMVNPMPGGRTQGLDTRVDNALFDAGMNIADNLPLKISKNSSIVSAVGRASRSSGKRTYMDSVEVLTVLPSHPAPNSFRPPYAGTDKSIRGTTSSIDWSWVKNLKAPSEVKTPREVFGNVQIDLFSQWQNSSFKTENTEHTYGRGIAYEAATSVLWLHLSNSKEAKLPTMIRVVQRGIDTFGIMKAADFGYWPNGGHNLGRKLPLLVAARALNDSEIMSYSTSRIGGSGGRVRWQEDGQHFFVSSSQVGKQPPQSDRPPYERSHVGMPDWTSNAVSELSGATPKWGGWSKSGYRLVNGAPNVGQALAAELSGLRDDWGWEPFFQYIEDRYWPNEKNNVQYANNKIYPFHSEMWKLYKGGNYTEEEPPAWEPQEPAPDAVERPTFSPSSGFYLGAQYVTLSNDANDVSIYFTVDGSTPDTSSSKYTTPIAVERSTVIKAIAVSDSGESSGVTSSEYSINAFTTSDDWNNLSLSTLDSSNVISFSVVPEAEEIDTVLGLSDGAVTSFSQLACILRFNSNGFIDARDGGSYKAVESVSYAAGEKYDFLVKIDVGSKSYSAFVRDSSETLHTIADDFAFRTEANSTSSFNNLASIALGNEATAYSDISNTSLEAFLSGPVPHVAISPASGDYDTLSLPVTIETDLNNCEIYYTLDGSEPVPGETNTYSYAGSFELTESCEVKAISVSENGASSPVDARSFGVNRFNPDSNWKNIEIGERSQVIKYAFWVTPSSENIDSVMAFSSAPADSYSDLACILRFNTAGKMDARNGSTYQAETDARYSQDTRYLVRFQINITDGVYTCTAEAPDGTNYLIAKNYQFRSEQSDASSLSYFVTRTLTTESIVVESLIQKDSLLSQPPSNLSINGAQ